ncbi:hypothetical protein [Natrinema versiforme]|uniref:Uncharacterized protein n=1 Tax=Natrinema versiforme TaxID=88724 RepID=A0A4V6MBF8_9EURY|nr:hypothetical protein [Natrinema versiforme]QCS40838.1 hypothetical protein FEJ81_00190 [Natrinema versiforme]
MRESRRTILKSVSSAAIIGLSANSVSGSPDNEHRVFENALEIVEETSSVDKMIKYMEKRGHGHDSLRGRIT